VDGALVLLLSS